MADFTSISHVDLFIAAFVSAAGGAAFAYIKSITKQLKEEQERTRRHSKLTDRTLCLLLRGQLSDEAQKLLDDGWVGINRRTSWQQTYVMYEELCEMSGTKNCVMNGIASKLSELPSSKASEGKVKKNG